MVHSLKRAAIFIIIAFLLSAIGFAILHRTYHISNHARIKAVGVNVWWDENATYPVSEIPWGVLEPNETKTRTVYLESQSNVNITLSLEICNWQPANASDFISLAWNYNGEPIEPQQILPIEFYLHVDANITGIDYFSFDILITASG